jgi:hypothetical protein
MVTAIAKSNQNSSIQYLYSVLYGNALRYRILATVCTLPYTIIFKLPYHAYGLLRAGVYISNRDVIIKGETDARINSIKNITLLI